MNRERRWSFWCGLVLLVASVGAVAGLGRSTDPVPCANSLWVGLGACAVAVPLGTLLALVLCRTDMPGRRPVFWLVASLLFLPLYLHAAAWDAGFGQLGWYSAVRDSLQAPLLRGVWAVMWIHGLWSVPWVTLIVAAALRWSEPELEEAALLDATYAPGVLAASRCGGPGRVSSRRPCGSCWSRSARSWSPISIRCGRWRRNSTRAMRWATIRRRPWRFRPALLCDRSVVLVPP